MSVISDFCFPALNSGDKYFKKAPVRNLSDGGFLILLPELRKWGLPYPYSTMIIFLVAVKSPLSNV